MKNWIDRWRSGDLPVSGTRLLLVTPAFPPIPESGSARWGGFEPHLRELGFGLDVLTVLPSKYDKPDWRRLESIGVDTRLAGIGDADPPAWYRLALRTKRVLRSFQNSEATTRSGTTITTNRAKKAKSAGDRLVQTVQSRIAKRWVKNVVEFALQNHSASHRFVVSSGPPQFVHLAAWRIAATLKVPHVIDLRDPWTSVGDDLDHSVVDLDKRKEILTSASLIICNTNEAAEDLIAEFPASRSRILVIPNACDLEPRETSTMFTRFTIAHCGSLYLDRDPRPFLRAVKWLVDDVEGAKDVLSLEFMGPPVSIDGASLENEVARLGLQRYTVFHGARSRDDVFELLGRSNVAVAFQGASRTQIPAKIFDYMAFPLSLFALVGHDSATAKLLHGTSAIVTDIGDEASIASALREAFESYRAGEVPSPIGADARFSRRRQAELLARSLSRLTNTFLPEPGEKA